MRSTLKLLSFFSIINIIWSQAEYHTINVGGLGGISREYYLYVPNEVDLNTPLIFILHGYSGSASGIMNYSGFNDLAEEQNFIACYPQGTTDASGNAFWNVGYSFHSFISVDDVQFIRTLSLHITQEYNLTDYNIFSTGMSNGGDMSYLLACNAPEIFKAIAPITGCMMSWIYESCSKNDPVPVFQVHGTKDNITYYEGDEENRDKWGAYMGVESTIQFWVDRNQCTISIIDTLLDVDKSDGSYIIRQKHANGINNNEVWFYKVINGGHDWPQSWPQDSGNQDLNTSEEIWRFFQHSMNVQNI